MFTGNFPVFRKCGKTRSVKQSKMLESVPDSRKASRNQHIWPGNTPACDQRLVSFSKGGVKRFCFNVLMLQQITVSYRNQSLKQINSEDALKGVLCYKKKKKGDFTSLLFA